MNTFFDKNEMIYITSTSQTKPIKVIFESGNWWELQDINENGEAIFTHKLTEEEKQAFITAIQKVNVSEYVIEGD